jgi:putative transposase
MTIFRKRIRLSRENYVGTRIYFVTICCDKRRTHLAEAQFATRVLALLHGCAATQLFLLHAYCVMPDHLHLLPQGTAPESNLIEFIRVFKLRTAFEFRQTRNLRLWEMSYYEHILRAHDSIEDVACYIWWNPVRKGLCANPPAYALSGSQTLDWMKQSAVACRWTPPWRSEL